jgi:hypothetical protein
MTTPIETSIFHVTSKEKSLSFGYPLKSISIFNDGPNDVRLRVGNSGYHTVKTDAGVDLDFDVGVKDISLSTPKGEADIKFLGIRRFENPVNYQTKQVLIPYQTYENSSSPQIDSTLLVGLIVIVAIIAIAGMVIAKK